MTPGTSKTRPPLGTHEYRLYRKLGGGKPVSAEVWKARYVSPPWMAVIWVRGESRKKWFDTHAAAVEWAHQQVTISRGAA